MSEYDFSVECARFSLTEQNVFLFAGIFRDDNPDNRTICVVIDGEEAQADYSVRRGMDVRRKYLQYSMNIEEEITGKVYLNQEPAKIGCLHIFSEYMEDRQEVYSFRGKQLSRLQHKLDGNLEMERIEDNHIILTGWAVSDRAVTMKLYADGTQADAAWERKYRQDVAACYEELEQDYCAGYEIILEDRNYHSLVLELSDGYRQEKYKISADNIRAGKSGHETAGKLTKAWGYYKRNGLRQTLRKVKSKLQKRELLVSYDDFLKKYGTTEEELNRQREQNFAYRPKFSIIVPLYRTKERFLKDLLESVQKQTYANWELCFADGSGVENNLEAYVKSVQKSDARIKYKLLMQNMGIAGNTNEALQMAEGDYLVLADHDDILTPDALYCCVKAINDNRNIDVLYSDEDKIDMSGSKLFEPHFKSDYNIDLLCSMNYICHMFVFQRHILEQVGGFESSYDGAQDHDFILRCTEAAGLIYHIPRVLYHWRSHMESTAANPESKLYAFENGCRAVEAHYRRISVPAVVERESFYGMYRTRYQWKETPLLSIIIPNKDHVKDLQKCIESIVTKSTYQNYELIIIENNSMEQETFDYYGELEQQDKVMVLHYAGEFNYSKINNFGAAHARGSYLLLLNNDTEMIEPDSIKEMLDICMRQDVGIVGARLFFGDNTIQHAGVIIGFGGIAGHAFIGKDREENGYFSRILCVQDMSAVTAACLMVKKSVYHEVGGLSEEFKVAFNDIDFCLKVRESGKLVVYNPYAVFYHYESKSRGQEDSADKIARFNDEAALFGKRWRRILDEGDPYYNPNLTLDKADFSLRE